MTTTPNPGSPEAVQAGCTCPVIDNNYGRGTLDLVDDPPLFWNSADCPLHGDKNE